MRAHDRQPDTTPARKRIRATTTPTDDSAHNTLSPQRILELQRLAGNTATSRLITAQRATAHDVLRTPGAPLADSVRHDMETRLNADFSDVRLHTDATAQRSAVELGADAYTSGNHIVASPGGLDRETLAHELVHVVQQRRGPVAGTDDGDGLRVSDPGDRFEREAEVVARQALSGRAPDSASSPGEDATNHVQRKVGFEAEIDLPVTKGNGQMFEVGDTKLGDSTTPLVQGGQEPAFEVVTDKRSLPDGRPYSNMEFVTGAVSVVGPDSGTGDGRLRAIADEMRTVNNQFHTKAAANPRSPLRGGQLNLTLAEKGQTAKLAKQLPYTDTREPGGDGGLFVHYSVGVPITGMPLFFDALRAADPHTRDRDPYNSGHTERASSQSRQARWRLHQARQFGEQAVTRFRVWSEDEMRDDGDSAREEAALNGYCQLVYTQLAGITDLGGGAAQTQPKNSLVVLSRSDLATVRAELPEGVQDFLDTFDVRDPGNVFAQLFDDPQENTIAGHTGEYHPDNPRQLDDDSRTVTFANYADSAFKRAGSGLADGDVTQEEMYGGMSTIAPHDEHGSVMIPMELRRFGGRRKTWDQLKQDLTTLSGWAQNAYRHDQALSATGGDQ